MYKHAAFRGRCLVLAALIAGWPACGSNAQSRPEVPIAGVESQAQSAVQRFEQGGIAIEFSLTPVGGSGGELRAGSDALTHLRLTDSHTREPIGGNRPKAWLTARGSDSAADEAGCTDRIRTLIAGALNTRAGIDLNEFLLLTLNGDKTISVINPQVTFSITKLESVIMLPDNGADWTLSKNRNTLYVTLPGSGSVAVIDLVARTLAATVPLGEGSAPTRIAMQPDGRYVWAGLDGTAEVAVVDIANNTLVRRIPTGKGLHSIAFSGNSRSAFVSNSADDSVSVVDTATLAKTADLKVGKTPVAVAYGMASRRVYVAAINSGALTAIDTDRQEVVGAIPVPRGSVAIGFEPLGRYALAVNQLNSTVAVVDSATNRVTGTVDVVKEPDQLAFTQRYAYVRGLQSEKFTLLDLNELRAGKLAPVDIQAGRLPPAALSQDIGPASMIAPTPEGNSVMIANAPDSTIYYYVEGMMAPMGTFSNYKRVPRALSVLDRSLTETAPGDYSALVRLTAAGSFDVPVLIDQPRVVHCFQVEVAPAQGVVKAATGPAIKIEPLFAAESVRPGVPTKLAFKVLDADSGQPITAVRDLEALVFKPPGVWQQRFQFSNIGGGVFEITLLFPTAGHYSVALASASRRVRAGDLPYSSVIVGEAEDASKGKMQVK
jgi:YVTN family beta-propeller protein